MAKQQRSNMIIPGQVGIDLQLQPGPNAVPQSVSIPINGGAGMKMLVFGGFTKQEQLAGMIAGHLAGSASHRDADHIAKMANDIAVAVLAEANQRQSMAKTPSSRTA